MMRRFAMLFRGDDGEALTVTATDVEDRRRSNFLLVCKFLVCNRRCKPIGAWQRALHRVYKGERAIQRNGAARQVIDGSVIIVGYAPGKIERVDSGFSTVTAKFPEQGKRTSGSACSRAEVVVVGSLLRVHFNSSHHRDRTSIAAKWSSDDALGRPKRRIGNSGAQSTC